MSDSRRAAASAQPGLDSVSCVPDIGQDVGDYSGICSLLSVITLSKNLILQRNRY